MPEAHILVVDDEPDIRELVGEILEDEGYAVTVAENGEAARSRFSSDRPDLVLLDIWMPDIDGITLLKEWSESKALTCPVVMMSGHGTLETAIEATRLGAHDFVQKPLSLAKLLATVKGALEAARPTAESVRRSDRPLYDEPVGNSPQMQLLRQRAEQAARHESPVLLIGETGSGREALAAWIHQRTGGSEPLVTLDPVMASRPEAEDCLFGDQQDPGFLPRAGGGTLFIKDLPQMPLRMQETLAIALESGQFTMTDSTQTHALGCRVIASASGDLEQLVEQGRLDGRLFLQLNVLPLQVPALRERPEDVPELVRHYSEWFPAHEDIPYRPFSISALNRLRNHSWPGNVRELRNLVRRLLIIGGNGEVTVAEVEDALRQHATDWPSNDARPASFDLPLREAREQFEREYLIYQLRKAGGSVGKLSEAVGMERTHLYRKLRALGIDPKAVVAEGGNT
ncbi:MAG: sigma-54 dependent transcriptional regulator [Xanthomonadales bacterium]|nr:sigma-54 dependent transcriptional regulator [Xanthomonadales bacterium]